MQAKSTINIIRRISPIYNLYSTLLTLAAVFSFVGGHTQQLPAAYTVTYTNEIMEWTPTSPQNGSGVFTLMPLRDVKTTAQYLDGLGRPIQTVMKKGSLVTDPSNPALSINAVDLVNPMLYDAFGRETYKYLPFAANSTGGNTSISNGLFKANPFAQQQYFYSDANTNSPIKTQGETFYYSKTDFEASPLNRVNKTFAPGNNWVNMGRGVAMKYYFNSDADFVRKFTVANGTLPAFGTYSSSAYYPAGELYKTITVDEHNKQVIEFKDKEGKIILKKVQLTAADDTGSGSNHPGWLCTYYIYDGPNNLRCVIQPRGVELLQQASWAPATLTAILPEQCFRYEYDSRNRMVMKKVPGANEVYMVYDARDRLVMTQDAKLRAINKWMVTLYDELNRPVQTGLLLNTYNTPAAAKTFIQHLAAAKISIAYPFAITSPPTTTYWEYLTKTGYDDYSSIPTTSGLNSVVDPTYINSTYGFFTTYNTSPDYAQAIPATASAQTKGMLTWTETKVLNTATYLYSVTLYDEKGRPFQAKSKNITGGIDITTTQYSWAGQPLVTVSKQEKLGAPVQTIIVVTKMVYDDLGRPIQTDKKIQNTNVNGNTLPANYTTINKFEYDALGQLKKKKIGNKPGATVGTPLANLNYDYNIRGWLLSVNKDYITASANSDQYFGMQLGYDKNGSLGTFTPQYNGNIGGTIWKSEGDQQKRKYDFTYDAVNRLTAADFNQYASGSGASAIFNKTAGIDFSVGNLTFDANGNILTLNQAGLKLNTSPVIDQLRYTYMANSNKLKSVKDFANDELTKLGDFKTNSTHPQSATKTALTTSSTQSQFDAITDYAYDVNGNLTSDNNKAISSITYNHLNLPLIITIVGKGTITYTYDASGTKLKKVTNEIASPSNNNIATTTTTTYLGAAVFETKTDNDPQTAGYTDKLQFITHEEGRIRGLYDNSASPNTLTGLAYDYMLKDHLGNVRALLTEEQKTLYYPAATLEGTYSPTVAAQANSMINHEKQFYNIDNSKVVNESAIVSWPTESLANTKLYYNHNAIPPASPNPNYPAGVSPIQSAGSNMLYKLNASANKTGLEFIIKVMAGDKIDIFGKSYFLNTGTVNNANSTALDLAGLMATLLNAPGNGVAAKGVTAGQLNTWNTGLVPPGFFRGANNETTTIPKAYINYIFLDEQFKYAGGNFSRVGASGTVKNHWAADPAQLQNILVPKNGYIFVYVSNESNLDVFFDNLQVVHKPGPILEETHYYPFGVTMSGISSKALTNAPENKYRYNDGTELSCKEFSDGSGLELYETPFRGYDPQIGRFWQIDEMADDYENWSPYTFSFNNPVFFNDPSGLEPEDPDKPVVTPASFLPEVIVKYTPKNNYNYLHWITFVEINKKHDRATINNILINQGVNDRGLKLFNQAWDGIGYRERLDEIEHEWREFVKKALIEGVTWSTGGVSGKLVSWGFRGLRVKMGLQTVKGRVFWSGGNVAKTAAINFAKANGMRTIEMTTSGRIMNSVDPYLPRLISKPIWDRLSANFARGAIGEVNVFHNVAGVGLKSTWRRIEYPILQKNDIIYNLIK